MDNEITLQIGITDYCNFKCKMCVQGLDPKFRYSKKGFMSFRTWKKIMDEMTNFGSRFSILLIWIGESFLHPEFFKFIKYAFENDKYDLISSIIVYTNGSLVTSDISKKIIDLTIKFNKRFDIVFSFVSDSQKTAELMNESTDFYSIVKNAEYFSEYAIKKLYNNIGINFQMVVTKDNCHEVKSFINRWSNFYNSLNIKFTIITNYYNQRWEENNFKISLMPEGSDEANCQKENNNIYYRTLNNLGIIKKDDLIDKKINIGNGTCSYDKVKCSSPWEYFVINWDGKVTVCCKDFNMELEFGDFNSMSFEEIYTSNKLQDLKKSLWYNKLNNYRKCLNCSGFKGDFSKVKL